MVWYTDQYGGDGLHHSGAGCLGGNAGREDIDDQLVVAVSALSQPRDCAGRICGAGGHQRDLVPLCQHGRQHVADTNREQQVLRRVGDKCRGEM